jgi:curved DNA-binding protein CbpA
MATLVDKYMVLNVPFNATKEQIIKAYRTLARKHHPDKNLGKEEEAADKFRAVR